jgi:hypothetical protein
MIGHRSAGAKWRGGAGGANRRKALFGDGLRDAIRDRAASMSLAQQYEVADRLLSRVYAEAALVGLGQTRHERLSRFS